jgi:glucose-1-phosphate thymidylyltransferase
MMKGIVLAGGKGTRLFPLTRVVSKQLLPVHDKPMVYYALSTLLLARIREILIVTRARDASLFQELLGDGRRWGIHLEYSVQPEPEGIAQALVLGKDFIGKDPVALVLGDNLFHGEGLTAILQRAAAKTQGATIFGCRVRDPERYGVIELDAKGAPVSIEEKPRQPRSDLAVTGLYFYDNEAVSIARGLKPSTRGEFEITDVNAAYLRAKTLTVEVLGSGIAWLDAGTQTSLREASSFVEVLEQRQGRKIGCPEEICFQNGDLDRSRLLELADEMSGSPYGDYLKRIGTEREPKLS